MVKRMSVLTLLWRLREISVSGEYLEFFVMFPGHGATPAMLLWPVIGTVGSASVTSAISQLKKSVIDF